MSDPLHRGGRVLAVDDQPENLVLVEEVLTDEGFSVSLASDGMAALEEVERNPPDCVILDIMMPRMDGFEVCRHLKHRRETHSIPVVMLTALAGVDDKVRAYDLGADDFLNKPVILNELVARVRSMVRIKRLHDELDSSENIVVSMVEALESKDPPTAGHSRRVAVTAVALARELDLAAERVALLAKGAALHDLGKIGLPDRLLGPFGGLDAEDRLAYREHTVLGERILSPFLSFAQVRALVRHHHERLDGSGYPDHLTGSELDLETEILALANHADSLQTSTGCARATAAALRQEASQGRFHRDLVERVIQIVGDPHEPQIPWQDLLPLPGAVSSGRILVASASEGTRAILGRILTDMGHVVELTSFGNEVESIVNDRTPDLILLDAQLPDVSGFDLCRTLRGRPETELMPLVLVAPAGDVERKRDAAEVGADDFLLIPVNRMELIARVRSLLRLRRYFQDLEEHQSVILSLASALEAKDPYTRGHSERVGVLAAQLGRALGLKEEECRALRMAGQLHDLGKIGMAEELLNKQGQLERGEFEKVKEHPLLGERICRPLRTMQEVLPLIRHHHERLDGSGYPQGLGHGDLPMGARILGLADAFDALTSARSYRQNFGLDEALGILARETREGRWDPTVFAALTTLVKHA